jgi:hypothetical protein
LRLFIIKIIVNIVTNLIIVIVSTLLLLLFDILPIISSVNILIDSWLEGLKDRFAVKHRLVFFFVDLKNATEIGWQVCWMHRFKVRVFESWHGWFVNTILGFDEFITVVCLIVK